MVHPVNIGDHIVSDFNSLYQICNPSIPLDFEDLMELVINDQDNADLCAIPELDEVWAVVRSIGSHKALGPDRMKAFFFKQYWSVIEQDVYSMVRSFFKGGYLLK